MSAELGRYRLTWGLTGPAVPARHYTAAQGVLLAILRGHDGALAARLHDDRGPKPYALSPLEIAAAGQPARASLIVGCWDDAISAALMSLAADGPPLELVGSTGILLDCQCCARGRVEDFLAVAATDPHTTTTGNVHVAFTTPTCFSLGKVPGGTHRYAITPEPGYVIASWWRRWQTLGGATFDVPREGVGPWLADRVVIHRLTWQSQAIRGGKTALTGGMGRVTYAWAGPERWGPTLLGALARCATFTGTGAKTTQGMGQTALAPPEARDATTR